MTPALHAGLLTLLHLGDDALTSEQGRWETVYNMLSLYGQLDERADSGDGLLTVPAETVLDFSAALPGGPVDLNTLPEELTDRMTYLADQDSFRVVCGDDNLAEIRLDRSSVERDKLVLSGSLVYSVDDSVLTGFRAVLRPADNLFGYQIEALTLA